MGTLMQNLSVDALERARSIRLLALDVDGVMTDGGLHYSDDGHEYKTFNVQDGLGLKLMQEAGFMLAIITGRDSPVVTARAADLGIPHVYQGTKDKFAVLDSLRQELALSWHECAFMGDDVIDLPAQRVSGLVIAPANAHFLVKKVAHLITKSSGGRGAVREAVEFILHAQSKFDATFARFLRPSEK